MCITSNIMPIFKDFSRTEPPEKCLYGKTQINNEGVNPCFWRRLPKDVYVETFALETGICLAVIHFNCGASRMLEILGAVINRELTHTHPAKKRSHSPTPTQPKKGHTHPHPPTPSQKMVTLTHTNPHPAKKRLPSPTPIHIQSKKGHPHLHPPTPSHKKVTLTHTHSHPAKKRS